MTTPASTPTMPTWADGLGSTLLMGFLEDQVKAGTITQDDLQELVNGARSVAAVGFKIFAANPQKVDLLPAVLAIVKKTPAAQQSIWDASIKALIADGVAKAETAAHTFAHSKLGLFAGPADALIDRGVGAGAQGVAQTLSV